MLTVTSASSLIVRYKVMTVHVGVDMSVITLTPTAGTNSHHDPLYLVPWAALTSPTN